MKKRHIFLAALTLLCVTVLFGCSGNRSINFVDRSEGWNESFLLEEHCYLEEICADSFPSGNCYAEDKAFRLPDSLQLGKVEEAEAIAKAELALQHYFGQQYIDTGSGKYLGVKQEYKVSSTDDGSAWVFFGGETAVVLTKATGKVLVCIDTRLQPKFALEMDNWRSTDECVYCVYTIDLAQLTEKELRELNYFPGSHSRISSLESELYDTEENLLPLTAEGAFRVVKLAGENGLKSKRLSNVSGDFHVYYVDMSDSYAVVTSQYLVIISKENGEPLFSRILFDHHARDASAPGCELG